MHDAVIAKQMAEEQAIVHTIEGDSNNSAYQKLRNKSYLDSWHPRQLGNMQADTSHRNILLPSKRDRRPKSEPPSAL